MTAVTVHPDSHHSHHSSQAQSYATANSHRQELPIHNGTPVPMNARPAVDNNPILPTDENVPPSLQQNGSPSKRPGYTNGDALQDRRYPLQERPTSAPHTYVESSQDESERERPKRRPRPLLRAKSDFGPRGEEPEEEEEIHDWGARHGFDDHYASEEFVSQLANVGYSFPICFCCFRDLLPRKMDIPSPQTSTLSVPFRLHFGYLLLLVV